VRFRIAPGWHIYWDNPGESGLRTKVTLGAPPGFVVGPVRYPGPERFESVGIVSYGYRDETMLLSEVKAPAALAPGARVRFAAEVAWLACKESCVPGRQSFSLDLPVASAPRGTAGDEAVFARFTAMLPRPFAALTGARVERSGSAQAPQLVVRVPGTAGLEFFPGPSPALAFVSAASEKGEGTQVLRLAFRTRAGTGTAAGPGERAEPAGVLLVREGAGTAAYFAVGPPPSR
jgi:thiol:disulfide interchange protein DsbD